VEVNRRASVAGWPEIVTDPDAGATVNPETADTVNASVPFGPLKTIVVAVELWGVPLRVTVQLAPDESPDSVKVTVYFVGPEPDVAAVNWIVRVWDAPTMSTVPEFGEAV
jgi:hypothetical protein